MIAEDDAGIMDAMKMILEMHGYEVVLTVDGAALQDIQQKLPDLLLLDIWMSGMDGREICKHLKSQEHTKHIPIIMVSAGRDLAASARAAHADDFLEKPFEMDELLAKIKQHLK